MIHDNGNVTFALGLVPDPHMLGHPPASLGLRFHSATREHALGQVKMLKDAGLPADLTNDDMSLALANAKEKLFGAGPDAYPIAGPPSFSAGVKATLAATTLTVPPRGVLTLPEWIAASATFACKEIMARVRALLGVTINTVEAAAQEFVTTRCTLNSVKNAPMSAIIAAFGPIFRTAYEADPVGERHMLIRFLPRELAAALQAYAAEPNNAGFDVAELVPGGARRLKLGDDALAAWATSILAPLLAKQARAAVAPIAAQPQPLAQPAQPAGPQHLYAAAGHSDRPPTTRHGQDTKATAHCVKCRGRGHVKKDCPEYTCAGCRVTAPGHTWPTCPNPVHGVYVPRK